MIATDLLRSMLRIRTIEETLAERYPEGEMRTPVHFSIGQEAIAVGVCAALRPGDVVYSGHRCHAHYLAKGGDLRAMVAELYGKETGCCRGRGGSVHLNDPSAGFIAASAILGQTIATAVGHAWAFKMDGSPNVAVCFFGDGAVEEGVFHEALNFAAVKQLPVLFVCENNGYSTHTPIDVRQPVTASIWERVEGGYDIPAQCIDGNDVREVYDRAKRAIEGLRAGFGPRLLECVTARWREHVGPRWAWEDGQDKVEVDAWMERCPITAAAAEIETPDFFLDGWRHDYRAEVDAAIEAAQTAPWPEVGAMREGTYA